ncbi:hypothetical protein PoMZ_03195 [Pyricularia oryzae]|uniref:Uncharacterized protein n=1 Tax=Pyricularia oryzae TaxID=318829 RepID=A0A4P7NCG3_PYROR|nr:hypothetical protein PoMZ_03195 [Pyricularia oryzae]
MIRGTHGAVNIVPHFTRLHHSHGELVEPDVVRHRAHRPKGPRRLLSAVEAQHLDDVLGRQHVAPLHGQADPDPPRQGRRGAGVRQAPLDGRVGRGGAQPVRPGVVGQEVAEKGRHAVRVDAHAREVRSSRLAAGRVLAARRRLDYGVLGGEGVVVVVGPRWVHGQGRLVQGDEGVHHFLGAHDLGTYSPERWMEMYKIKILPTA